MSIKTPISEVTIQLAEDTLVGDVQSFLIDRLRDQQMVFGMMDEDAQRGVIADAKSAAEHLVERAVEIIAADGKDTIPVTIGKLTHDGKKIAITLECRKEDEHRHALLDATGGIGYLVVAETEKFEGGEAPQPDPNQPDLIGGKTIMDNGQGFGSGEGNVPGEEAA